MAKILSIFAVFTIMVLTAWFMWLLNPAATVSIFYVLAATTIPMGLSVPYLTRHIHAVPDCKDQMHYLQAARWRGVATACAGVIIIVTYMAYPRDPSGGLGYIMITASLAMFGLALRNFKFVLQIPKGTTVADYDYLSCKMFYS